MSNSKMKSSTLYSPKSQWTSISWSSSNSSLWWWWRKKDRAEWKICSNDYDVEEREEKSPNQDNPGDELWDTIILETVECLDFRAYVRGSLSQFFPEHQPRHSLQEDPQWGLLSPLAAPQVFMNLGCATALKLFFLLTGSDNFLIHIVSRLGCNVHLHVLNTKGLWLHTSLFEATTDSVCLSLWRPSFSSLVSFIKLCAFISMPSYGSRLPFIKCRVVIQIGIFLEIEVDSERLNQEM